METLDVQECLEDIAESIRKRKMSFWVGAGISLPTLPLGSELKFSILEGVCAHPSLREYRDRLRRGKDIARDVEKLPLEWIVQVASTLDPSILDCIIRVFKGGSPNKNHFLIAELLTRGFVSQVLTTNLDLLLDRVLERDLGWQRGSDFNLLYSESQFEHIASFSNRATLFKIHGSADDESSVRITLNNVASRTLSDRRAKALKRFVGSGDILILGYSARDDFDINPILSKTQSRGRIFYVRHVRKGSSLTSLPKAFSEFSGSTIRFDTAKLVNYLWESILDKHQSQKQFLMKIRPVPGDWRRAVEAWAEKIELSQRFLILGSILLETRRNDSYQLFRRASKACVADRNYSGLATALYSMGMIEQEKGRYKKALTFFGQTLRLDRRLNDQRGVALTLRLMAKIQLDTGNFPKASRLFVQAANILYNLSNLSEFATAVEDLAVLEMDKENYRRATVLFSQAKEVFEKFGNLSGIAEVLQNLAIVEERKGNLEKASRLCRKALDRASSLSDQPEIASALHHLGTIEQSRGNYVKAKRLFDRALEIRLNLADQPGLASTTSELARLEALSGNYSRARVLYNRAKKLFHQLGHLSGVANCLQELAMVDVYEGKYRRAINLSNQSLEIRRHGPNESVVAALLD